MSVDVEERTFTVLLSDDSKVVRKHLVNILADLPQIEVVGERETVAGTIEAVDQIQPDVVILDINMPDGSGIDALKYIKRSAPQTEVIMLTNHANPFYQRACIRAGARYFFDKSTEFKRVSEVLNQMVRGIA
jgi:DNA-binding NarL/FixJ family response regulator